ncbi:MAG TPA: oxidoreductase [Anaerolineales bacterium]|nr:oxidoreductase [Anaerolineales bacterium]
MPYHPIHVGIIGAGMSAQVFHLPTLLTTPAMQVTHIVARQPPTFALPPHISVLPTVEALLNTPTLDLVIIATPNITHYPFAKQALLAGKHVVIEKPFTNHVVEAQELITLAKRQNRLLSVYHNRRWDGDFLTVKHILASGWLGQWVSFESRFDRFRPQLKANAWREQNLPGSGVLFDLAPHLIDQALQLFGMPKTLRADLQTQRDGAIVDDFFDVWLGYGTLQVRLSAGMLVRDVSPRFAVRGTQGIFTKYGLDPQEARLKAGELPTASDWGQEPAEHWGHLQAECNGLHVQGQVKTLAGNYPAFYRNIAAVLNGQAELAVQPEQALQVMQLLEIAHQSNSKGETVTIEYT